MGWGVGLTCTIYIPIMINNIVGIYAISNIIKSILVILCRNVISNPCYIQIGENYIQIGENNIQIGENNNIQILTWFLLA